LYDQDFANLNSSDVLSRLDAERRSLLREGETLEQLQNVTRIHSNDDTYHLIMYAKLSSTNADGIIAEQTKYYRQKRIGFEWKVYGHDEPADLLQRLERHGFRVGALEAVMIYDLTERADWMSDQLQTRTVVRVDRGDLVQDFRRVAEAVFQEVHEFTANQLVAGIATGSRQHCGYVAYSGLDPVSIGRLYTHHESQFGGLFGGGTLATHRGSGFYRAVVGARARDAKATGAHYLIVDALPTSRPILERLGFQHITDTWPCILEISSSE
jgi:hypothetical protein